MRKNFTKLVCVGIACFYMASALAQDNKPALRNIEGMIVPAEEVKLRAGEKEQPDSVVRYDDFGHRASVHYYADEGPRFYYSDYYKTWCSSLDHFYVNLWPEANYDVKYNSKGLVESITYPDYGGNINNFRRVQFQYNEKGYLLSSESHIRPINSPASPWQPLFKTTYLYDAYENWVGTLEYYLGGNAPVISDGEYSARVDNKGRIIYSEYNLGPGGSMWINEHRSQFCYYIWHYSDGRTPNVDIDNNDPVGNDNQGSFDLEVNIPTNTINNGSITITFPEGFTLDEKNTSLTLEFADLFDLIITKQDNNSWLFEIKPKTLKSASLRADEVSKMLQVAYTVDEKLLRGSYDISVHSILFESKGGNYIPEPAITVPVQLNRWGVSNVKVESNNIWASGGNLYIRTDKTCTLSVFTVYGQLFKQQTINAGETIIPLPQGIYFVKAEDTTKKIIAK